MFAVLALVLGAGCEELLPKFFGVGFPVLLMVVVFLSVRFGLLLAVMLAIAAGATEDALSALTPMTSVSFFLIVAVLVLLILRLAVFKDSVVMNSLSSLLLGIICAVLFYTRKYFHKKKNDRMYSIITIVLAIMAVIYIFSGAMGLLSLAGLF